MLILASGLWLLGWPVGGGGAEAGWVQELHQAKFIHAHHPSPFPDRFAPQRRSCHPSYTPLQSLFSSVLHTAFSLPPSIFRLLHAFPPPPAEEGPTLWLLRLAPSRSPRALHPVPRRATDRASVGLLTLLPQGRHAALDPFPGRNTLRQPARQEGRRAKEREKRMTTTSTTYTRMLAN